MLTNRPIILHFNVGKTKRVTARAKATNDERERKYETEGTRERGRKGRTERGREREKERERGTKRKITEQAETMALSYQRISYCPWILSNK